MKLFGGLDIGTNGVRIVIVDEKLQIKYESSSNYSTLSPREGWAEQDPEEVFTVCLKLLKQVVNRFNDENIIITFSSVMHSIMLVDNKGHNLSPLLIWADKRALKKRKHLENRYGTEEFYNRTLCPLHSTYWPARILWLKDNANFTSRVKFVSIKEYIIYKLIGKWKVDLSLASTSGIFNYKSKNYDPKLLNILGVTEQNFSKIVSPGEKFNFNINGKNITGLMGATDGVLANIGVGAITPRDIVITVGTSSAIRFTGNYPVKDPEERIWSYILDEDYYVSGEATNGAGLLIKWLAHIFEYEDEKEMIAKNIAKIPYKTNELICMPTMMGERGPNYNEQLQGLLYGLSLNHSQDDIIIALYESIVMFSKMIYDDVMRVLKCTPESIIITGGLGLSKKFSHLLSYLFGELKYLPGHNQNTAIGAAMLGIKNTRDISYSNLKSSLPERNKKYFDKKSKFQVYIDNKYNRFLEIYRELNSDKNNFK